MRKAYDSVAHTWIIAVLEKLKIASNIRKTIENSMRHWHTTIELNGASIANVKINRGIFQGDSLSPMLFVMSLIPLSWILNSQKNGYKIEKHNINHLIYMDDLKIYGSSNKQTTSLVNTSSLFLQNIGLELGPAKCASATLIKGKEMPSSTLILMDNTTIRGLQPDETYKYLGVAQSTHIHKEEMRANVSKEYHRRVRKVAESTLNGQNKIQAINTWAIPILRYTGGIMDWTKENLHQLDTKTRKILTINRMLHPKADVDRIYLPRQSGGRGLMSAEDTVQLESMNIRVIPFSELKTLGLY